MIHSNHTWGITYVIDDGDLVNHFKECQDCKIRIPIPFAVANWKNHCFIITGEMVNNGVSTQHEGHRLRRH